MSFTSIVKNEVSKLETEETYEVSELSAIISNSEISQFIKIITENPSVARYIYSLIKNVYKINPKVIVRKGYNYNKKLLYIIEIPNKKDYLIELGLDSSSLYIPKGFIYDDPELIRAYLKGLFLICGSINDPKTSRYHLEFVVDTIEYADFVSKLLNTFYLKSKYIKRENKYMVYIKEAEKIGDFLRVINATSALLYYEDIRIYRDHKNMTNRLNNCEQANVDKIIETASNQVKDIELIESIGGLDLMDEKTKVAAIYRLKYRDASLLELSDIINIETGGTITKSGLHHRFQKIKLLAEKIRQKGNS